MAYPNRMIWLQSGKTHFLSLAPIMLLIKELAVDEKELTITKNRVEILRMMFATASCNSPKCSIATKNRNHGATLINE